MQVIEKTPGRMAVWSLDGTVLTIAGQSYDMQSEQGDVRRIIGVRDASGSRHVATIIIPPYSHSEAVITDEYGYEYTTMTPDPIDVDEVTLEIYGEDA